MAKLRTNADARLRAGQLLSQLSSLTQVEVEISRLVTSTKRTALRVSAQLRTQQPGHGQEGRRRCSGNVGRAMVVPYWLILHTATPMTKRHIRLLAVIGTTSLSRRMEPPNGVLSILNLVRFSLQNYESAEVMLNFWG